MQDEHGPQAFADDEVALPMASLAARLMGKTAAETISAMLTVFGRIDRAANSG